MTQLAMHRTIVPLLAGLVGLGCFAKTCSAQALELLVNPTSGSVSLHNQSLSASQPLDGYALQSASGSLTSANFSGFAAHGIAGWQSVAPSATSLSELNLTSSSSLRLGASYGLGNVFTSGGSQDLGFQYSVPSAPFSTVGPVVYTNVVQLDVIALLSNGGASIQSTVAAIVNGTSSSTAIDGYSITSASGSLSTAGFKGFAGHGVAGWQSVGPSSTALSELNLSGSSTLAATNGDQVLGTLFTAGSTQDLTFQYTDPSTSLIHTGLVLYSAQLAGDANNDGIVNGLDINAIATNWLHQGHLAGDVTYDGIVNGLDINVVATNWLHSLTTSGVGSSGGAASVPEPSTVSLLLFGIAAWIAGRRHTDKKMV